MTNPIQPTTPEEQAAMTRKIPISGPTGIIYPGDRVLKNLDQGYVPFAKQELESDVLDEAGNPVADPKGESK